MTADPDKPPPFRQAIADRMDALLAEAKRVCGPGATAYGYQIIRDRLGLVPDRRVFVCRRPEHRGWHGAEEMDVRAPENLIPPGPWRKPDWAFGFVVKKDFGDLKAGQVLRLCRWDVALGSIEEYRPQTQAQLDRARDKRRAKAVRREMDRRPLFADMIRRESYPVIPAEERPIKVRK